MAEADALGDSLLTPGQRLREAREAAGISQREMADRLNWLPPQVQAMEEDRYETFRSAAFVRGYLRAYGRAVRVDTDELVAGYGMLIGEGLGGRDSAVQPTHPASSQTTGLSVVMGLVIAVVVIAGIWWQSRDEQAPAAAGADAPGATTPSPLSNIGAGPSAASRSEAGSGKLSEDPEALASESELEAAAVEAAAADSEQPGSAAQLSPEGVQDVLESEADASVETAPQTGLDIDTDATGESVVSDGAGEAAETVAAAQVLPEADADALLEFDFRDDCWVEVRDGDGRLIVADLKSAGETIRLGGTPPFTILVGNAPAVSVRYRGEDVAIVTSPGRNRAEFLVGEQ
jgi:cytoskeleton protein RodZ